MGTTNFDEVQLDNGKLYDSAGLQILADQQGTITAAGAYSAPTPAGAVPVTSQAATDLDTAAAQVASLTTKVNAILTAIKAHGLIA